jgi:hypothetical protein
MPICVKKKQDTNPCSPTYGHIIEEKITCPPDKIPIVLTCNINISGISITPITESADCFVGIGGVEILNGLDNYDCTIPVERVIIKI